jgi:hypothetical protein
MHSKAALSNLQHRSILHFDSVHPAVYMLRHIYWYTVFSLTAKFFIVNVNQKGNMFRRFLDRHHQAF